MNRYIIQFEIITEYDTVHRYYTGEDDNRMSNNLKDSFIYEDEDSIREAIRSVRESHVIKSFATSDYASVNVVAMVEAMDENRHRIWVDSKIKEVVDGLDDV